MKEEQGQERGHVISLGSINVDFQVRVERWPGSGESMLASDFLKWSGGKGANVAMLARRLGLTATLLGCVGDDELAPVAMGPLEREGVDTSGVAVQRGCSTGVAMISVRPDADKTIVLSLNANDAWEEEAAQKAEGKVKAAAEGSVVVADLEVPLPVVKRVLRAARERGLPTVLDPSPAERFDAEVGGLSDFVMPNAGEASRITGVRNLEEFPDQKRAAEQLLKMGSRMVFLKLGDGSCLAFGEEGCWRQRPEEVPVVDTTGAGDAFAGGFASALAEGEEVLQAVRWAVSASHLAVAQYGSQSSYARRAAVSAFVERLPAVERCK